MRTPTPWKLHEVDPDDPDWGAFELWHEGATDEMIVNGAGEAGMRVFGMANAAFIVKAANAHDMLVETLTRARRRFAAIVENDFTYYDHHKPRRDGRLPREDGGTIWLTPREMARREIEIIDAALAKLSEGLPTQQPEGTSHATKETP